MAEPPFQMPGHRWDPDKRRFFKIIPGSSGNSASASTSSVAGSASSNKLNKKKGKQRETAWTDEMLASTPRLPAIDIRTPAQKLSKHRSAFQGTILDPVSLRQQAGLSVTARQISGQARTEATYSHLALSTARRPFFHLTGPSEVIGLQTDADHQSLIVLAPEYIVRTFPTHGVSQLLCVMRCAEAQSFIWRSSQRLWFGFFEADETQKGICSLYMPTLSRDEGIHPAYHSLQPSAAAIDASLSIFEHREPVRAQGQDSWAFAEVIYAPLENGVATRQNRAVPHVQLHTTISYALATGALVAVRGFVSAKASQHCRPAFDIAVRVSSDVMALGFNLDGRVLYCGTRSGKILAWQYFNDIPGPAPKAATVEMPIEAEGSVTNLAVVSDTELLIVRINGKVQLVDMATGQTKQRYLGHVNSYQYKLGCAVDKESRLLALAGLDRRVRVWSLDSPLPLGTAETSLASVLHPFERRHEGQQLSNELYDESDGQAFLSAHPPTGGHSGIRRGSTLSTIVFRSDPGVLHWHPRYAYEGVDPYEAHAIRQGQDSSYRPPRSQWKDLFVGVGEWLYQFRFP